MTKPLGVRLPSNTLFDNFILRSVLLDAEVSARLQTGRVTKGFITGVDGEWLQITEPKDGNSTLVHIPSIQEVTKTNTRIANLPKGSRDKMKSMTHAIRTRYQKIAREQNTKGAR